MSRHILRRSSVIIAVSASVLALAAGPAAAHVEIDPGQAARGGYANLTFQVPNEQDNAQTVKFELQLPASTPIAFVTTKPVPGWSVQTSTSPLPAPVKNDDGTEVTQAVSLITWTAANGNGIGANQFQDFEISAGPLPDTDKVIFTALQTYSDGTLVSWSDPPTANGTEPAHPAPVLTLVKNADPSTGSGASGTATTALILAAAATVVGLAGLIVGILGYRRGRATATG